MNEWVSEWVSESIDRSIVRRSIDRSINQSINQSKFVSKANARSTTVHWITITTKISSKLNLNNHQPTNVSFVSVNNWWFISGCGDVNGLSCSNTITLICRGFFSCCTTNQRHIKVCLNGRKSEVLKVLTPLWSPNQILATVSRQKFWSRGQCGRQQFWFRFRNVWRVWSRSTPL